MVGLLLKCFYSKPTHLSLGRVANICLAHLGRFGTLHQFLPFRIVDVVAHPLRSALDVFEPDRWRMPSSTVRTSRHFPWKHDLKRHKDIQRHKLHVHTRSSTKDQKQHYSFISDCFLQSSFNFRDVFLVPIAKWSGVVSNRSYPLVNEHGYFKNQPFIMMIFLLTKIRSLSSFPWELFTSVCQILAHEQDLLRRCKKRGVIEDVLHALAFVFRPGS